jgi:hemerythrin superfamily protein
MARKSDEREAEMMSGGAEKTGNGGGEKTDAIEMLKADHRRVEELFGKYEQARRRAEKSKIAQQICLELTIHAELEEELFYPACREHVDDPLLDEAQVEHDTAKILVAEIAMGAPQADPFFDAKVGVLAEYMRAHIQEEEKNPDSIFAKALEGGVDTLQLGRRMKERREELMEQFDDELLLPQPKTLHVTLAQDEEVWSEPPRRGGGQGRGMQGRGGGGGRQESRGRGSWGEEEGREREGGYDERREGGEMRGRSEEEQGRQGQGQGQGQGGHGGEHRGWHGDPKRHSEASRRGWEHRR